MIAKRNKPQIPISDAQRDRLTSKIIKARLGKPYQALLKKYQLIPEEYLCIKTDFCYFEFFIITDKDKFKEGVYKFNSFITIKSTKEYPKQVLKLIPTLAKFRTLTIDFFDFYGVSDEYNSNLEIKRREFGTSGYWKISEYDEWLKLVEAAADMLMYYLPHIGSVDDFIQFVQAYDAGETNFNQFTLPETRPDLRGFCSGRYYL